MLVGLFRHWHFSSNADDLGIFDQAVWLLSRFEVPASTIGGHANIFGDHFHPILVSLVPLYWIAPAPETLIVVQSILLAVSAIPVCLLLRTRLPNGPALALTATYLFFWGMQCTAWFDFHEIAFAPLLIACALLGMERRRWTLFWIACAILMLVKEEMPLFVATLGVYMMATGERRHGRLALIIGVAVTAVVFGVVFPSLNDVGEWKNGSLFSGVLTQPWRIPIILVTPPEKLRTVLYWLLPFLFLPLRSPLGLLLVPTALSRLLSAHPNHWSVGSHYAAVMSPLLVVSAGDGLMRLTRGLRDPQSRRRYIALAVGAMLVIAALLPGHQPVNRIFAAKHYRPVRFKADAARALAVIPAGASVVAQSPIVPHLSHRAEIFVLDARAPDAAYVIAAPDDVSPWPLERPDDIRHLIDERRARGYRPVFQEGNWIVLARQ